MLLCDDEGDLRSVLINYLQSAGYIVLGASDANAVLCILEVRADIDLVIIDYDMPDMNGLETIREARLRRPELRWLLMTGTLPSQATLKFRSCISHSQWTNWVDKRLSLWPHGGWLNGILHWRENISTAQPYGPIGLAVSQFMTLQAVFRKTKS